MTVAPTQPGAVTVRVPAKVNLELRVGPRRPDGFHDARDGLPGRVAARRGLRRPAADDWQVVPRGRRTPTGVPTDGDNLAVRAARLARRALAGRRAPRRSASTRTSRSPAAWPAARPTRPPPSSPATRSGASASTATSCRARRRARQRRPVRPARRHRDGLRAAASSSRPLLARGTFHWVFAIATAACPRPRSTPSATACASVPARRARAAGQPASSWRPCARATPRRSAPRCTTTSSRRRSPCDPQLRELRDAGARVRRPGRRRLGLRARPSRSCTESHEARSTSRCARGLRPLPRPAARQGPVHGRTRAADPAPPAPVARRRRRPVASSGARGLSERTHRVVRWPTSSPSNRVSTRLRHRPRCSTTSASACSTGDRIGVVGRQRRRQVHPAARPGRAAGRRTPAASRSRAAPTASASACSPRTTPSTPRRRCARPCSATCPSTSGPATPASATCSTGLLGGIGAETSAASTAASARCPAASAAASRSPGCSSQDPDLLLLDEPTNHLDVEGVAWLADHLARTAPARQRVVAITHDRWFLDAVATAHVGGRRRQGQRVRGRLCGLRPRARPSATGSRRSTADRRANLLRKELAWLRRGPPARTTKPKFRIDAANALIADEPPPRDSVELASFASRPARQGRPRPRGRHRVARRAATSVLLDHVDLAARPRATGSASSASTAPASRPCCAPLTGDDRRSTAAGARSARPSPSPTSPQEVRELERFEHWRVIEAIEDVSSGSTLGDKEISASQLATRLGFPGGASRRASATCPVASAAGCS